MFCIRLEISIRYKFLQFCGSMSFPYIIHHSHVNCKEVDVKIMKICTKTFFTSHYWTIFNHYNNSPYSTAQGNYGYKMICLVRIVTHSSCGCTPHPSIPNEEILEYIEEGNRPTKPPLFLRSIIIILNYCARLCTECECTKQNRN